MPELAEQSVKLESTSLDEERRGSFRCDVQAAEEVAILRTRRSDLKVRLTERSAGGFGLWAPANPPIKIGEILALATINGCCEVRVAHITELEGQSRVGLKHVRDLAFMPSLAGGNLRLALMIALCVAFFTLGAILPGNWWREMLGLKTGNDHGASQFSNQSLPSAK